MTTKQVSLIAYEKLRKTKTTRRVLIYQYITKHPDKTEVEIIEGMGFWCPNFVRPQITELYNAKYIYPSGIRKCMVMKGTATIWRCC